MITQLVRRQTSSDDTRQYLQISVHFSKWNPSIIIDSIFFKDDEEEEEEEKDDDISYVEFRKYINV